MGITRYTNRGHIARAVLESMCFQVNDVLGSMHKDAGEEGEVRNESGEFLLRVDGGATVNNLLMQIQVQSTMHCKNILLCFFSDVLCLDLNLISASYLWPKKMIK